MKTITFFFLAFITLMSCQCKNQAITQNNDTKNITNNSSNSTKTENNSTVKIDKNGMLYIREGENVFVEDMQANVTFKRMIEDSRCPMNARCIWIGVATAEVEFMGLATRPVKLKLSSIDDEQKGYSKTAEFNGYTISLDDVLPATTTEKGFEKLKGTYKIGLRIAKGTPVNPQIQRK